MHMKVHITYWYIEYSQLLIFFSFDLFQTLFGNVCRGVSLRKPFYHGIFSMSFNMICLWNGNISLGKTKAPCMYINVTLKKTWFYIAICVQSKDGQRLNGGERERGSKKERTNGRVCVPMSFSLTLCVNNSILFLMMKIDNWQQLYM